jgi:hypothetical protein
VEGKGVQFVWSCLETVHSHLHHHLHLGSPKLHVVGKSNSSCQRSPSISALNFY